MKFKKTFLPDKAEKTVLDENGRALISGLLSQLKDMRSELSTALARAEKK